MSPVHPRVAFALAWFLVGFVALPAAQGAEKTTISCIGDSNTDGWPGSRDYTPYTKPLQEILGEEFKVLNFGKSNTTLLKGASDPYWKRSQFGDAMKSEPDLVTIVLGTNDAKSKEWSRGGMENFQQDYEDMLDTLAQLPTKPQVVACTPFHMLKGSFGMSINTMENEIVPAIRKAAAAKKVKLIDLYEATDDAKYFDNDGVHVNNAGHEFFAGVFKDSILAYRKLWGCTDSSAGNFNADAIRDDGSCTNLVGIRLPARDVATPSLPTGPAVVRVYSLDGSVLLQTGVSNARIRDLRRMAKSSMTSRDNIAIVQVVPRRGSNPVWFRVSNVK